MLKKILLSLSGKKITHLAISILTFGISVSCLRLLSLLSFNIDCNYLRLPHQRWVSLLRWPWIPRWRRWQSQRTYWWRSWCSRQWQNLCRGETEHKAAIVTPISIPYQPVAHCGGKEGEGKGKVESHFASAQRLNTFILTCSFKMALSWSNFTIVWATDTQNVPAWRVFYITKKNTGCSQNTKQMENVKFHNRQKSRDNNQETVNR